jgi:hypothetical protein
VTSVPSKHARDVVRGSGGGGVEGRPVLRPAEGRAPSSRVRDAATVARRSPRRVATLAAVASLIGGVALLAAAAAVVLAQPARAPAPASGAGPAAEDLLSADADPAELARAVARLGDDAVLALLGAGASGPRAESDGAESISPAASLAAVRAAPHLTAPEDALALLAGLAAGRDPDLAPAASLAAWRIAERLAADPRELERREADPAVVASGRAALRRVAADPTARHDVRQACAVASALLDSTSVNASVR